MNRSDRCVSAGRHSSTPRSREGPHYVTHPECADRSQRADSSRMPVLAAGPRSARAALESRCARGALVGAPINADDGCAPHRPAGPVFVMDARARARPRHGGRWSRRRAAPARPSWRWACGRHRLAMGAGPGVDPERRQGLPALRQGLCEGAWRRGTTRPVAKTGVPGSRIQTDQGEVSVVRCSLTR